MNEQAQNKPARQLRVRFAQRRDFEKVRKFYEQNQSSKIRDFALLETIQRSELERLYVIEETQYNRIVAAGACGAYCDGRFVELRDAVVRWKGYGLHRLLTHIRTLQSLVMTHSGVTVFCVVEPVRTELRNRMEQLGFAPWPDPPEDFVAELASRERNPGDCMRFTAERIEEHRQSLLDLSRTGMVRHVATGDLAGVSLEILLNADPRFKTALEISAPVPR
jgi:hypothetical protein